MKKSTLLRSICLVLVLVMAVCALFVACNKKDDSFKYEHDPKNNPSAMADIVEDKNAIYGFRPSETGSLANWADADWSDPEVVEKGRQDRIAYHTSLESMYVMLSEMTVKGDDIETIARAISERRNVIRLEQCKTLDELNETKQRNQDKYGNPNGPTPEYLYEQYGSWEMVLTKAFSVNSGMDACLGLYDQYYDLYVACGQIQG